MPDQINAKVKNARYNEIMKLQQQISKENSKKLIGKTFETLIEDAFVDDNEELWFTGRTYMDVPEIDGLVFIKGNKELQDKIELNTFVNCKITEVREYDLIGEIEE